MALNLLLGQTLQFTGDPFQQPWQEVTQHRGDGAVLVEDGHIRAVGTRAILSAEYPQVTVTDYGEDLIVPGFVDSHVHYPQTAMIASWGSRLIDWLNIYTFPEEMLLPDPYLLYTSPSPRDYYDSRMPSSA